MKRVYIHMYIPIVKQERRGHNGRFVYGACISTHGRNGECHWVCPNALSRDLVSMRRVDRGVKRNLLGNLRHTCTKMGLNTSWHQVCSHVRTIRIIFRRHLFNVPHVSQLRPFRGCSCRSHLDLHAPRTVPPQLPRCPSWPFRSRRCAPDELMPPESVPANVQRRRTSCRVRGGRIRAVGGGGPIWKGQETLRIFVCLSYSIYSLSKSLSTLPPLAFRISLLLLE